MHESLIDDDDLLNEEDGLGGEGEGAAGGSAEDPDGGDDEVANQRRRRAREHERRRKERKREERDAKAVAMVLKAQAAQAQALGGSGEGHLSEKELKKLNHKKLRQHAQDVGVDKDEMDEMYKDEDAKRDWAAILAALKRLAQEARPESRMLIIATLALFVDTCVGLAIPAYFGKILDTASAGQSALQPPSIGGSPVPEPDCQNASGAEGDAAAVAAIEEGRLATCLSLIALTVIGSLCGATRDILFSVTGQRVVLRLRKRLFKHMMQQDVAFFDKTKSGELVNRLSADVMMLKSAVEHSWAQFISSLVSLVATLFYLFFVSWKLTLLMMATPPAIIIIGGAYGAYLERVAKATQDALAGATDSASESISGLRTVRAFANERTRLAQYIANVQMSYTLGVKVAVSGGIFGSFMGLVVGCAIGLILYVGAGLVIDGEMTAGTLTSYLIYCMVLAGSMGGLAGTYGAVMTAAGANRRVFELLDGPPPRIPLEEGRVLDHTALRCSLRFKDVCFSYPTRPTQTVLHNVSFSVEAGQKVALVGRSGCGKSTIMNLIMRFYDPTAGTISFAGEPLRELQPAWLHRHIGLVAQEPLLFGCTIAENIAFGVEEADDGAAAQAKAEAAVAKAVPPPKPPMAAARETLGKLGRRRAPTAPMDGGGSQADPEVGGKRTAEEKLAEDEKVMEAARMCNAHDFIMDFDDGYETLVGERGVQLSGMERRDLTFRRFGPTEVRRASKPRPFCT